MSQNVARLKELLFDRESATLAELQARIAEVAALGEANRQQATEALAAALTAEAAERAKLVQHVEGAVNRAGTEEQFRTSVAVILDGAIREAEVSRHEQLSRAVAPLVVKTIKTELRNSQDEMVEALYPITGRMVKAYIASAMKDLTDQINRRLAGGTNPVMLRLRSLMTGRSVAELALAETQRLEVVELYLIRRGSGELVQHWPDGPQGAALPSNSDIHLSGVLTAINDFAGQALKDDGGNLRSFDLDDFQMYLRASPTYLLAAKCRGSAPAGVEAALDDEFLSLIEDNGRVLSHAGTATPAALLPPLARRLEARLEDQQRAIAAEAGLGFNPLKALAVLVLLPLVGYLGWSFYTGYETALVRDFAARAVAATPQLAGYPTQVDVGSRGRELKLTGLVPTPEVKADIIKRLRDGLPETNVIDQLTALPNFAAEFEPQVTSVRRSLAGIEGEAVRASVRRGVARASRRIDQAAPYMRNLIQALADANARATAQSTGVNLERIAGELRAMQSKIGAGPVDMTQLNGLAAPMHDLSERMKQAGTELSLLLSRAPTAVDVTHGDAAPADIVEAAEELSLAAEQLATVAVAVAQSAGVKPPPPPPLALPAEPTARERLEKWVKSAVVFFGDGTEFRSAQVAEKSLETASQLIRAANVVTRVVGYTDERGGQSRNTSLAQTRAQRVVDALVERGVPRQLLIAVGRPIGQEISASVGPQSPNRRVEFEIGFEGEMAEQP